MVFSSFTAERSRYNDYSEGFGNVWEGFQDPNAFNGAVNNGSAVSITYLPWMPGASYQTVLFKPLSGILNQRKYIPWRLMQITIELSLADDPLEPIISKFNNYAVAGLPANAFTALNTSTTWQNQNLQAKCDLAYLDNGLHESNINI